MISDRHLAWARRGAALLMVACGLSPALAEPLSEEAAIARGTAIAERADAQVFFAIDGGVITRVTDFWPEPYDPQWKGGYFCPCHKSKYDIAGRVYKAQPAPLALPVPARGEVGFDLRQRRTQTLAVEDDALEVRAPAVVVAELVERDDVPADARDHRRDGGLPEPVKARADRRRLLRRP